MPLGNFGQPRVEALAQKLLQEGRLAGSFLIDGPVGVGKETFAVELGRLLNCESAESCQPAPLFRDPPAAQDKGGTVCSSCRRFFKLQHPDLQLIFPVPSGVWIKEPKTVLTELAFKVANPYHKSDFDRPMGIQAEVLREVVLPSMHRMKVEARFKILIISDADKMAFGVGNLLLKTLEEPREDCLILLTSSVPDRLLSTILSRCQRLRLAPLASEWMIPRLQLVDRCDPAQARIAALVSQGSMTGAQQFLAGVFEPVRDRAFTILEQAGNCDLFELLESASTTAREYGKHRTMFPMLLYLIALVARDALVSIDNDKPESIVNEDRLTEIRHLASMFSHEALCKIIRQTQVAERQIAGYAHSELTLGSLFMDVARQSEQARAMNTRP